MADTYYCCCSLLHGALAMAFSTVYGAGAEWPRSLDGRVRVTMRDTDAVPAEVATCPSCLARTYEEQAADQHSGRWVRRAAQDPAWTGTELGVLVPEADATEAHAVSAGGLAYCPRVTVEGVMHRLVRYTDRVAPDALSAYTQLTAEEVVSLAATEVR